ncbi:hypothetical protein GMJAKD_00780 [Candidatus Electrothrix aarhusensis]
MCVVLLRDFAPQHDKRQIFLNTTYNTLQQVNLGENTVGRVKKVGWNDGVNLPGDKSPGY